MSEAALAEKRIENIEEIHGQDPAELARADFYSILAKLFYNPPTSEFISFIADLPAHNAGSHNAMALSWRELQKKLRNADLAELNEEFNALFIGVGRGELLPFGSWYQTGFMMDRPLSMLRDDLKTLGFERHDDVKEPEDHVAALCESMAMIIRSGEDIPFATQQRFFSDHLEAWMGRFFDDLNEAKTAKIYKSVGKFGRAFFDFETQYFDMMV
ncbi:MAG: molecular chaperone TorD family protein [Gammaproteobacteria bacterium]|nr:molecular chaperone TorD family protein [Gammaproteobacteria bacterium]